MTPRSTLRADMRISERPPVRLQLARQQDLPGGRSRCVARRGRDDRRSDHRRPRRPLGDRLEDELVAHRLELAFVLAGVPEARGERSPAALVAMERLGIDKPVAQVPGAPETAGEQFGEELLDLAGNTTFDEREHLARDPGECLLVACVALAVATQVAVSYTHLTL